MEHPRKWSRTRAHSVHALTATGAVFAMFALLAAVETAWSWMFLWLLAALFVDGIDGPLARKYDVQTFAARFDGVLLDLIIDYLTYVFIPVFALYASGLVPGWPGWGILIVVPFASALYFADVQMKTEDASFEGFPGCWNMFALVVFVTEPNPWLTLVLALVLSAAMFLPIRFVHPVRTARWRPLTLALILLWMGLAVAAAWGEFGLPPGLATVFALVSLYLLGAGAVQQFLDRKKA
ncbi:CDP-alcohol phosphatidyltransferase family protein [Jannaschia aquimarina]|uniref:Phosphatidylcholine synthase n=1 Tax=Jannaschia aquimarina TaxID=935700 RepID=A0A0D1EFI4_9RHOB|nr:CDP-alcohol phosphatidyltransferase family protein [Jannaschia aquimarina]KIT16404.1 Phosphatidylcholine synthase [Jannaschia aquimarina]SNS91442.1 phosphatidylcholine synthase [Jannaschia aquimarina]